MRGVVRAGISLAVVALTAVVPRSAPAAAPIATELPTVTLISGDRLLIAPDGASVSRLPSPGRDDVPLFSRFAGGRLEVIPADALPLLDADRLDHRLFDVTELVSDGYDDNAGGLPLIITGASAGLAAAAGGAPVQQLETMNAVAVRVPPTATARMWSKLTDPAGAYRKVWLDGIAKPSTDVSVPLVGAPAAWAAGWTGAGVGVGVLDSGIDATHPDLAPQIAAAADFTGAGDTADRSGHGTHVASIIAGSGAASGGRFRGMAPDARLYSATVCRDGRCPESAILAGMQWAARDENLKIVSMSLGRRDEPGDDLLEQAVNTMTARYGTLFVVSAGNAGERVTSPASADAALAVGATTLDDHVASFSDAGPRAGDNGLKPDLVAPGVGIEAARSSTSALPKAGPGGRYTVLSGTSMAAPHVAGAAAILAQEHPGWTPGQLKADLMNAATPIAGAGPDQVGAGRLDVAKATAAAVVAVPPSLSFGPQTPAGTITYRNVGPAPVTLALTAPAGTALTDHTVTVPARGDVEVGVSAPPSNRRVTGTVTAAGGDISVRTPYEVQRPVRTYRLTVRWTGRDGQPAGDAYGGVWAGNTWTRLPDDGGTGTVELPAGTYALDAAVLGGTGPALLDQPALRLDADTTIDLSAAATRPITVPAPATPVFAQVGYRLPGGVTGSVTGRTFDGWSIGHLGAPVAGVATTVAGAWSRTPGEVYAGAWASAGAYPDGFAGTVDGLATIHRTFGGAGPVALSYTAGGVGAAGYATAAPAARTEYLTTAGDVRWSIRSGAASGPPTAYANGQRAEDRWDAPVAGPAFPPANGWGNTIRRDGGTITVHPSWFSDGSGAHGGAGGPARHHLVVSRDGTPVAHVTSAALTVRVPARAATITITDDSTRAAALSTRTHTSWTIGPVRGDGPLPVSAIRFTPGPGGVLAFAVQRQPGAPAGTTRTYRMQVSYDDGATWRTPLFTRLGDAGVAVLRPPAGAYVSLRASATDGSGNRVDQTVIRAYRG